MLRTLLKTDIDQLILIEQAVHVAPWNRDAFLTCFDAGFIGWVIEENHKIVGYILVSLQSDECHILNLGVAHLHQRHGFGHQLLAHVLAHAKKEGFGIAYLEVRRSNSRAIGLYRKAEFHQIGERKNYYPTVNGQEDALVFAKSLRDEV